MKSRFADSKALNPPFLSVEWFASFAPHFPNLLLSTSIGREVNPFSVAGPARVHIVRRVSRQRARANPPSAFITKMALCSPREESKAILCPSGDHRGGPADVAPPKLVNWTRSEPSPLQIHTSMVPSRSDKKTIFPHLAKIRVPNGNHRNPSPACGNPFCRACLAAGSRCSSGPLFGRMSVGFRLPKQRDALQPRQPAGSEPANRQTEVSSITSGY